MTGGNNINNKIKVKAWKFAGEAGGLHRWRDRQLKKEHDF
jgi:hypothetical protein